MTAWQRDLEWERAMVRAVGDDWLGERPKAWRRNKLAALVSRDEIAPGDLRWHISVQHKERVPAWNELASTAHELRPGVPFVIGVPPRSWWINVHENVLHLFETHDDALIAAWRFEGRGDRPT